MREEEVIEVVINAIAELIEVDKSTISMECSLMDDLDISSLEAMALMGDLETKTGIVINNQDIGRLVTVTDIVDMIMKKMAEGQHYESEY